MDQQWAMRQIDSYVELLDTLKPLVANYKRRWWDGWRNSGVSYFGSGPDDQESLKELEGEHREAVARSEPIVERIIERVEPELVASFREAASFVDRQAIAHRARSLIAQHDEISERLGVSIPSVGVSGLHRDVAAVAAPFWDNHQYREAVNVAARAVNANLQRKLGRRDVSESDLVRQGFSLEDPKENSADSRF